MKESKETPAYEAKSHSKGFLKEAVAKSSKAGNAGKFGKGKKPAAKGGKY